MDFGFGPFADGSFSGDPSYTTDTGILDRTLDPLTMLATGSVLEIGDLAKTLDPLTLSATGHAVDTGGLSETLGTLTLSAAGILLALPTLENLAVWSIPPDWSEGVTETLEWLTSVLSSPIGAEQRFAVRSTPRRSFEMTFKPHTTARTLFDLFMERAGGSDIYLPLWHDTEHLTVAAVAGFNTLTVNSLAQTEFKDCPAIFIQGQNPFSYELIGYFSESGNTITTTGVLKNDWPVGSRVFPAQKCRVETQPQASRKGDRAFQSRVKFSSDVPNPTSETISLTTFEDQFVLEREPNDVADLTFEYQRLLVELDNQSGLRRRKDLNEWGITVQQFAFFLRGRTDNAWLRALFYQLQGRKFPILVPTFFMDFELTEQLTPVNTMIVKRCGYTDFDGPFRGRQYLLILLRDGTRLYRRIAGSALIDDGTTEQITLDTGFSRNIGIDEVQRISFMALSRLDSDSLEIVHQTDTYGVSTCTTNFRSILQVRSPHPDPSDVEPNPPPPPPPPPSPSCVSEIVWKSSYISGGTTSTGSSNSLDEFKNHYVQTPTRTLVFDPTSNVIASINVTNLADMIDSFAGSAIVTRYSTMDTHSFLAAPVLGGHYVVAFFTFNETQNWVVVLQPSAIGAPTILGAAYYSTFLGPPYGGYFTFIGVANGQTADDPLLFRGYHGIGGGSGCLAVVPSVNEIINSTFPVVPADLGPLHFRAHVIGFGTLSGGLLLGTGTPMLNLNRNGGWVLPDSDSGTNLYFYFNRAYTDYCRGGVGIVCGEVKNVIGPIYPDGSIIKLSLGPVVFDGAGGSSSFSYTFDEANWVSSVGANQIPFTEEYTYLSDGAPGGSDVFTMQPGNVIDQGGGKFWVVYYMPGIYDAKNNTHGTLYEKIRIFEYDSSTEIAKQIMQLTCIVYSSTDIPPPLNNSVPDYLQSITVEGTNPYQIFVNGYRVGGVNYKVYESHFGDFTL